MVPRKSQRRKRAKSKLMALLGDAKGGKGKAKTTNVEVPEGWDDRIDQSAASRAARLARVRGEK